MKRTLKKMLAKLGYQIKPLDDGFSFNNNLMWLKNYNINSILDIGGNEGQYIKFINNVFPKAKIYSFEPISSCFLKIEKLSKELKQVTAFNFALGDSNELVDFNLNVFTPSSSIMKMKQEHITNFPHAKETNLIKIEIKRLDDVISQLEMKKDVLVKIDVQGYESRVLKGGYSFFSKIPKIIIVEASIVSLYEQEASFAELYDLFRTMGYKYMGNMHQLYSPVDGSVLQVDAIFIK